MVNSKVVLDIMPPIREKGPGPEGPEEDEKTREWSRRGSGPHPLKEWKIPRGGKRPRGETDAEDFREAIKPQRGDVLNKAEEADRRHDELMDELEKLKRGLLRADIPPSYEAWRREVQERKKRLESENPGLDLEDLDVSREEYNSFLEAINEGVKAFDIRKLKRLK